MILDNKNILITGGTGSLGKVLVKRLLSGDTGTPKQIVVFSRDEAKQHFMRLAFLNRKSATDEVIYQNFKDLLTFRIGDVRDFHSVSGVVRNADIIFNAAALKQVPSCEYFPYEAVQTNIGGPENIVRAIREHDLNVETVVGISTDKAVKPVNVMGMTKAIQERVFLKANLDCKNTRFVCVRYGNVLASRGSVIPFFHDQITKGGPVTITTPDMTRFLLTLDQAVDTVFAAVKEAKPGETYIPRVPSARIIDVADALIEKRKIKKVIIGVRPGEKIHEILITEEEIHRTLDRKKYYAIASILPELAGVKKIKPLLKEEFSSKDDLMSPKEVYQLLKKNKLLIGDSILEEGEMLR
ncbi:MAG: NAD-dependent epimerase/dehydratase family protein [Euryarchaeota archaeon]|nr:NAD-dependent epimerase/dehydratase family protein [Euryarchaeota archaeon]MBU4038110.1 polysaccharide biosynthesis protein [Pseudomonadota bacterium]